MDFFLGPNYLVTVHDGGSRSIAKLKEICSQHAHILEEGPVALLHRIVDSMIDNYAPEMEEIEEQMDELEEEAILGAADNLVRPILAIKRDLSALRRVVIPQRDVVGRLARREFPQISNEMAYRFRDVYDHLVRYADEATMFQDRVTGILGGLSLRDFESTEPGDESAHRHVDDRAANDRIDRLMGDERAAADVFRRRWCAVLVAHRDHGLHQRGDALIFRRKRWI